MERARCLRAVSQIALGRLRTLSLRPYGRLREELAAGERLKVRSLSQKAQPEAEKCRDGAPKGERARKRMPAVTRTVRGARRTGQRFGCAHPKCRCGG